ncbi:MAG: HNH endonuclease [Pseudomonadota bacterium]
MTKRILTRERVLETLGYSPVTGVFIWKDRPRESFKRSNSWEQFKTRRAGKVAGCVGDHGYILIRLDDILYKSHRLAFLIMTGEMPEMVDHINHNSADNRWINLKVANHEINHKNKTINTSNKSGITGVSFVKSERRWIAFIGNGRKKIRLGRFDTKEAAAIARADAEKLYGFHPNHGKAICQS